MRVLPRLLALPLLGILALGGCKRGGGLTGNSSATGNNADQDQKQQQQQQKKQQGAPSQPPDTEPQTSVTGKPSADSDRGSPSAVAHHSVAQPGAPQGTAPEPSQKPAPKPPPAQSASPQH
ncbi:MAG TPA: hypothetical protein VF018_06960 [Acidobacteriaceae bacterium]